MQCKCWTRYSFSIPIFCLTSLRQILLTVPFMKLFFHNFQDTFVALLVWTPLIFKCPSPSRIVFFLSSSLSHIVSLSSIVLFCRSNYCLFTNEWIFVSISDQFPEFQPCIFNCWLFISGFHCPNCLKLGWLSSLFPQICNTHVFLLLNVTIFHLSSST